MSKHMQLTIHIRPYYRKGLKGVYPRIADVLSSLDKPETDDSPSLFDIAGKLDRILYDHEGNQPFREILLEHRQQLKKLYSEAQSYMADWKLADVDQILYRMEDIFDDIERELGRV